MDKNCTYDPVEKVWKGRPFTPLYHTEGNLGHTILSRLRQNPEQVFQVSDDTGVELTNSEIYSRTLKFANHLTGLGIKQHDVVGLIALNSENVAPLIFSCLSIGAAVNPLSMLMNEKDIVYHWSKTQPKVVFIDAAFYPVVSKAFSEMNLDTKIYSLIERVNGYPFADDILEEPYDVEEYTFPNLPNISTTNAFIMCSSGTTGMPKGVCKSHQQILYTYYPWFKLSKGREVAFCNVTSYWISHSLFLINSALYGIKFVITKAPLGPDLWMDIIERHNVTIVFSVPAFIALLLKSNKIRKFETVKTVIFAGCPVPPHFIEKVQPLIPNGSSYICYGATEFDVIANTGASGTKGTSSGFPARNFVIKITDDNGNSLGPNERGEICFKTAFKFPGYFNNPEATVQAFDSDNFMKSGDLGYFDEEGFLYVIDRFKHLIKSKDGYRVTPAEIEIIIDEMDGVLQSCVVGVEDKETFIDFIYAFVIKRPTCTDLTEKDVMNYVNERVCDAKKVSGVIFVDKFPMTQSMKIINRELREVARKYHEENVVKC